jgi:8-oxo-dGTP pyrophosphatase MutT (NUDIX family)
MTANDGNGWTRCSQGHRHWGRHGAAGLLVSAPDQAERTTVLLQQRSMWGSHSGTWSPPGGARDSHESAVHAALREAAEECAVVPAMVSVHGLMQDDHGDWTFMTVLANVAAPLAVTAASGETRAVAWVPVDDVSKLMLHPGFAAQWPALREVLAPLTIIVDAANVMGARPDGWWRDRAGAAVRLCDELAGVELRGVRELPGSVGLPALELWFPQIVVVLEGAARAAADHFESAARDQSAAAAGRGAAERRLMIERQAVAEHRIEVVRAPGSGDDEIARLAAKLGGYCLVVTADRDLQARCLAAGASVIGPRWLLDLL